MLLQFVLMSCWPLDERAQPAHIPEGCLVGMGTSPKRPSLGHYVEAGSRARWGPCLSLPQTPSLAWARNQTVVSDPLLLQLNAGPRGTPLSFSTQPTSQLCFPPLSEAPVRVSLSQQPHLIDEEVM